MTNFNTVFLLSPHDDILLGSVVMNTMKQVLKTLPMQVLSYSSTSLNILLNLIICCPFLLFPTNRFRYVCIFVTILNVSKRILLRIFMQACFDLNFIIIRSRGSSIIIVSDCGLDDRGLIPNKGRGFFL